MLINFTTDVLLFIDILKIDNLDQFKSLVKLQLDNNIIERIEGLSSLVHLEWLGTLYFSFHLKLALQQQVWLSRGPPYQIDYNKPHRVHHLMQNSYYVKVLHIKIDIQIKEI